MRHGDLQAVHSKDPHWVMAGVPTGREIVREGRHLARLLLDKGQRKGLGIRMLTGHMGKGTGMPLDMGMVTGTVMSMREGGHLVLIGNGRGRRCRWSIGRDGSINMADRARQRKSKDTRAQVGSAVLEGVPESIEEATIDIGEGFPRARKHIQLPEDAKKRIGKCY